jgi:eukaryotic-like serine/threonine-protein kinase
MNLYEKPSDGSRRELQLFASSHETFVTDWSSDGRYLLFQAHDHQTHGVSAWIWPIDSPEKASLLVDSRFNVTGATLSPGMRWLAYASDESGRDEIYIRRFPEAGIRTFPLAGRRTLVSTTGGTIPHWRRDGRELFFTDRSGNIVAVNIREDSGQLNVSMPIVLFNTRLGEGVAGYRYDISADGQRFLIVNPVDARTGQFIMVLTEWSPRQ